MGDACDYSQMRALKGDNGALESINTLRSELGGGVWLIV